MALNLKPLAEQTIVVTGATSGIGLTIAKRAAAEGARVILVSRDEADLKETAGRIERDGGRADWVAADMGVRADVKRVVDTVVERHGGFDTWVNNAGVGAYAKLEELTDEDHEQLFQTNYWGVVYGSTEALRQLRPHGGALINIGSIASDMPSPLLSAYAASKHAVKGFTGSLRLELMHDDAPVSVTLIKPSGIHTPFGSHARNYMDEASRVPPPVYHPDRVADAVLHAAQTPVREITVGGIGFLQTVFAYLAPALSDRVFEKAFFATARDPDRPKRRGAGFYRSGEAGQQLGDQSGYLRETSLYTTARMHPFATLGLVAAAGLTAAAVAGGARAARR